MNEYEIIVIMYEVIKRDTVKAIRENNKEYSKTIDVLVNYFEELRHYMTSKHIEDDFEKYLTDIIEFMKQQKSILFYTNVKEEIKEISRESIGKEDDLLNSFKEDFKES